MKPSPEYGLHCDTHLRVEMKPSPEYGLHCDTYLRVEMKPSSELQDTRTDEKGTRYGFHCDTYLRVEMKPSPELKTLVLTQPVRKRHEMGHAVTYT